MTATTDDLLSDRELYDLYMYQPHNDALRAIARAQYERTAARYEARIAELEAGKAQLDWLVISIRAAIDAAREEGK